MNRLTNSPVNDQQPTILVIEDNSDQWFLTRWALQQRFTRMQIDWLSNANQVLPYLDACRPPGIGLPKLILVDLYLPGADDGLAVLKTIKSHPCYKVVPTFTLSWSNSPDDITQAFTHSANGYLVKPTNYQDWIKELSILDRYWHQTQRSP